MSGAVYRVRLHGRGGQGIKTAGRVLGTALFLEGFEVQDAPRYGAERRGAPIFAFVRAARGPILERGAIQRPDLVLVADDTVVVVPAAGVLAGITARTVMVLCSEQPEDVWRARLAPKGPLHVLPLPLEDRGATSLRHVGMACAGAAARLLGVVSLASLRKAIETELAGVGRAAIDSSLAAAERSFAALSEHAGAVAPGEPIAASGYERPAFVELLGEPVLEATAVVHGSRTSELVKTGLWRTVRPEVHAELCHKCHWICASSCPDGAISAAESGVARVDYDHCKGCGVCVVACPHHAIAAVPERSTEVPK